MALSKQDIVDKILSFDYETLAGWIRSRLHGDDRYFPIYEGYETNLSQFLADAYNHIKNTEFRKNFIEILNDLVNVLRKYSPGEIDEDKEFFYELLTLCGTIKDFENKTALFKIAKSGKLKGIKLRETDLHLVLLTTLLSYRMGGNYRFWVDQMQDGSNKYYSNAAYYALLKHGYRLDILFKQMGLFIERFKGDIVLVFAIEALFDYHEPGEIYSRFKQIEPQLTLEQKEAVSNAFLEAGYEKPFGALPAIDRQSVYKPLKTAVSVVGEKPMEYETAETLQEKTGKIFQRMGAAVHFNYQMAGHTFDIFIQRKKLFTDDFECYVCRCREGQQNIDKEEIERFADVAKDVKDCTAVFVSGKDFTKGAQETAKKHGILLKTLHDLESR